MAAPVRPCCRRWPASARTLRSPRGRPSSACRRRRRATIAGAVARCSASTSAWRSPAGTGVRDELGDAGRGSRSHPSAGARAAVERRHAARRGPSWPGSPRRPGAGRCVPPNRPQLHSWTSSAAVRPGATSRSASSSSSSRRSSQRSSSASWLSSSSSTVNPGGRPASTGNSNRIRRAKACSVPIGAWSRPSSAARAPRVGRRLGRARSRRRWRSSAAAFSVNVMAAIASIGTPSSTSVRMRPTSAVVLPAPAPASTNSVAAVSVRMRSRAAVVRRERRAGARPRPSSSRRRRAAQLIGRPAPRPVGEPRGPATGRGACAPTPPTAGACRGRRARSTSSRRSAGSVGGRGIGREDAGLDAVDDAAEVLRRPALQTSSSSVSATRWNVGLKKVYSARTGASGRPSSGTGGGGVDRELEARAAERRVVGRDACRARRRCPSCGR